MMVMMETKPDPVYLPKYVVNERHTMEGVSLFCQTGKLKEAGVIPYSSLLMYLMSISPPESTVIIWDVKGIYLILVSIF